MIFRFMHTHHSDLALWLFVVRFAPFGQWFVSPARGLMGTPVTERRRLLPSRIFKSLAAAALLLPGRFYRRNPSPPSLFRCQSLLCTLVPPSFLAEIFSTALMVGLALTRSFVPSLVADSPSLLMPVVHPLSL